MLIQQFDSFFAMGGFGTYVWSAFGITALVLLWLLFSAMYQYKKTIMKLRVKVIENSIKSNSDPIHKNFYASNS